MKTLFEKVPLEHATSYTIREFILPAFDTPMHFHPEFELTYIVAGTGKRVVGDQIVDFGPGDLAFIGSNLPHYWHSDKQLSGDRGYAHSIVLQFSRAFLGQDFFNVPELSHMKRFLHRGAKGLSIDHSLKNVVAERMARLPSLQGSKGVFEVLGILDELSQFPDYVTLCSEGFINYPDVNECEKINKVCKYVFNNFTEEVNIAEAAAMIQMNPPAFCYYFKKRTRKTFSEFVNDIRIGYSCKLLIGTQKSIAEVCFSSGFNNLSNFNRRFRDVHRISPTRYRRQMSS